MLPAAVVEEIHRTNRASRVARKADAPLAWSFPLVHILQSDIVGFTKCVAPQGRPSSRHFSVPLPLGTHRGRARRAETRRARLPRLSFFLLFSPFLPYSRLGSRISPEELCGMLHNLFSGFDEICEALGVYKIETIVCPPPLF